MAFQCIAVLFDLSHQMRYRRDGEGIAVCDVVSLVLDLVSECTMTLLIFMLASGWMTTYVKFNLDDGMEVYAPLFMVVIMVHIMFGALTFIDQDSHLKHHDFEGWVGYCLMALKMVILGVFFYFYSDTKSKVKKESL
jgi:hypothetical protein